MCKGIDAIPNKSQISLTEGLGVRVFTSCRCGRRDDG